MTAAKGGKRVAICDRFPEIGGGCVHWGTIPSKVLRHAIGEYVRFRRNPIFASACDHIELEYADMLRAADAVISKQVKMRRGFYERNDVTILDGYARFIDPHTIEIERDGTVERARADVFVIAVGTRPYRPDNIPFDHPRILDANTVLELQETPGSITVYGAGVIGCEYASVFRNLGCKVNLINTRDRLLSFLDDEISDALSYHLRDQGAILRHNEAYERVVPDDDGVTLHLKSGKRIRTDT
jgi:NAD(P) transhydrogenase